MAWGAGLGGDGRISGRCNASGPFPRDAFFHTVAVASVGLGRDGVASAEGA